MLLRVGSCSGTSGGGFQDAPEGSSGTYGPAQSGVLQPAVSGGEGDGDLSALNGFVTLTKFKMETVASVLGSVKKGDWIFLTDLKDAYL